MKKSIWTTYVRTTPISTEIKTIAYDDVAGMVDQEDETGRGFRQSFSLTIGQVVEEVAKQRHWTLETYRAAAKAVMEADGVQITPSGKIIQWFEGRRKVTTTA